jgi:DNA excision repair protein ERCC-1
MLFIFPLIVIHERQKRNEYLMKHIKNAKYSFTSEDLPADFIFNSSCAIYLSAKYHIKNENFIKNRIVMIGKTYKLRVLLLHIDSECDPHYLKGLNALCANNDFSLGK